jgi:hypothetical protein
MQKNMKKIWDVCKQLGGHCVGPKKRQYLAQVLNDPSIEEWNEAMEKTGGEGGCEATIIGRMDQTEYDGKKFTLIDETSQVDYPFKSRNFDEQERKEGLYKAHLLFHDEGTMHQVFRKFGNNRSVPKGRAKKELWHRALTVQLREAERIHYNSVSQLMLNMYTWGKMPMHMQINETFKIDKKNARKAPKP